MTIEIAFHESLFNCSSDLRCACFGASHTYIVFIEPDHVAGSMDIPVHVISATVAMINPVTQGKAVQLPAMGTESCARHCLVENDDIIPPHEITLDPAKD